jgi:hypothetical protein
MTRDKQKILSTAPRNALPEGVQRDLFSLPAQSGSKDASHLHIVYDSIPFSCTTDRRYFHDLKSDQTTFKKAFSISDKVRRIAQSYGISLDKEMILRTKATTIERKKTVEVIENGVTKQVIDRDENGQPIMESVQVFPGGREDKVEAALRSIAERGNVEFGQEYEPGVFRVGVRFTLYKLKQELDKTCKYSLDEIKEALEVLATSPVDLSKQDQKATRYNTRINDLVILDRDTRDLLRRSGEDVYCRCFFHPMISESLAVGAMRLHNTRFINSLSNEIARHIYKQMCLHFTWAAADANPYIISRNQIFSELGKTISNSNSNDLRDMRTACKELLKVGILAKFDDKEHQAMVKDEMDRRKTLDAEYMLIPSSVFIENMIESNRNNTASKAIIAEYNNFRTNQLANSMTIAERATNRRLLKLGLDEDKARELIDRYELNYINEKLDYTEHRRKHGAVKSPKSYFLGALRDNYTTNTIKVANEKEDARKDEVYEEIKQFANDLSAEQLDFIYDTWSTLDKTDKKKFLDKQFDDPYISIRFKNWKESKDPNISMSF